MTDTFNAATYLTEDRVAAGDGDRVAFHHPRGALTYRRLTEEVRRVAAGLVAIGVRPEERVLLAMVDDVELATGILAVMYVGAVAVPSSTMLTGPELGKLVVDSRARVLLGSSEFTAAVTTAATGAPDLRHLVVTGDTAPGVPGVTTLTWDELRTAEPLDTPYPTWAESPALWLYTSGTTGTPKGAMHRHTDIRYVCETYGREVLRIGRDDVCLSGAKLFFAYGIGNSLFFPLSVGAAAVLEPARPNPARFGELTERYGVTLFFGGPSFWGPLMAADLPPAQFATVRNGVSAGEALPARMFHGVREQYGFEILDGIGSTEALHIFISNVAGAVVPGSSGFPVPGYRVELRRPDGSVIEGADEPGMLYIAGDSICTGYWCRTEVNRRVFQGEWMRTGDQYVRGTDGSYTCLGRADDVLKVGGIWVSPTEVEARLMEHPDLAEAVVVGVPDSDGLDKPVAYVVPRPGVHVDADEVIAFCRAGLASFKRPRLVVEVSELPRTATGKIQRFRLRELAAATVAPAPTAPTDVAESQA
ncbi:benzoate-CoA ligase family protein [Pseudonocardia sp. KRD-184]|uniref:Benzoate-CoA ligase family protein n=1 Tax=Pseudonocardia oceani TaxID=2792013 RepID=A0ABS6UCK7_9PSEU|nr:benzoate-CoA ligase family protein [Pseudonocardia oceani]MBW0092583.1 benzoate-CoA ligase family protein [Pseudonocardia oceani]MBW0097278.1 benzoate-CoA ligase family protein [Pseudonocardia oceani]MBW0107896.1 benzoate-CoA ligase family protein [Pseudonocardia oceani]MBW0121270.1 benzoate-CoA ligase family protein [Pseudonocardia oceani]MBW0129963.1 benzoate-CoA ligase family protein [Pseudonocardia oceani]